MKLLAMVPLALCLALGQGRMEAPTPGRFEVSLGGGGAFSEMSVVLYDSTGYVRTVTAGAHPNKGLVVVWLSGRCDDYTLLTLTGAGADYELTASVRSTPLHGGHGCSFLDGVGRSVTVELSASIQPRLTVKRA